MWYSFVMLRLTVTIIPFGLLTFLLGMGNAVGAAES
jgi:hypothetical protein